MEEIFTMAGLVYLQLQAMSVEAIESLVISRFSPDDPLAVACLIDDETPFRRLAHFRNLLILRTSLDRRVRQPFEHVLPWVFGGQPGLMSPLRPTSRPRLAFCGFVSHPQRAAAIKATQASVEIDTIFVLRDRFWGGRPHDPALIAAYEDNMRSCEFNLCPRGAGNFSMRLYHTLAAGRIPVIIRDETTLLPFEQDLDWNAFAVIAETADLLPEAIRQFHARHDIVAIQRLCAQVQRQWFATSSYPGALLRSLGQGSASPCP